MYGNCCIYLYLLYNCFIYLQIAYHTYYTPWCIGNYIYYILLHYYHHNLGETIEQNRLIKIFLSEDALVETKLDWISFELAWSSVWFSTVSYEILHILPENTC